MKYHYTMCGLDYVYLCNGYQLHDTPYGKGVTIERAEALDRSIAFDVLVSQARLRGQEVRFLRSLTRHSQTEIAAHLGLKRVTVARWEGAPNTPIPGPADRALRAFVANDLFGPNYIWMVVDQFSEITDERPAPLEMMYRPHQNGEQEILFPDPDGGDTVGWKPTNKVA